MPADSASHEGLLFCLFLDLGCPMHQEKLADVGLPPTLFLRTRPDQQKCPIHGLHSEGVLLASDVVRPNHRNALSQADAFCWIGIFTLTFEAAQHVGGENKPSSAPQGEVPGFLQQKALKNDVLFSNCWPNHVSDAAGRFKWKPTSHERTVMHRAGSGSGKELLAP